MKGLRELLEKEYCRLEKIERQIKLNNGEYPDGRLKVSNSHNYMQYYHITKENDVRIKRYLRKSEFDLVQKLAQKEYEIKVLRLVEKRLKQLKPLISSYQDDEIEEIYTMSHIARQEIIKPVEETWEQKVQKWIAVEYVGKSFASDSAVIYSEKGQRVRSKSEKILADYLERHNIPYKYEKPLNLKGYGVVYPDFTFLSSKKGKEVYWEHEGMMDDPIYASAAISKIKTYEENGIYIGDRLILTFETKKSVFVNAIIKVDHF